MEYFVAAFVVLSHNAPNSAAGNRRKIMPFAQESQVSAVLRPMYGDLVSLVQRAHRDWMEGPYARTMQDPKVRANVIWNQFLYYAKAHFEGSKLVRVESKAHCQGLLVGTSFFVRMKKGTNQLLSRNYPTQAALDFNDASVDLFDGVARLELIYTLDELGTTIDNVVIAQRHRSKILWAIDLLGGAEDRGQTVIPLPVAPADGGTPAQRVLKPKKFALKPKKTGNGHGTA